MEPSLSSESDMDELIEYKPYLSDNNMDGSDDSASHALLQPTENKSVRCKVCNEQISSVPELTVHFILQHQATGEAHATLEILTKKQARAMPKMPQKYICGFCGDECFDTLRETRQHIREVHGLDRPNARDSGADYSEESNDSTYRHEPANGATDGASSGMLSGMSDYVSSPDTRTERRSQRCPSSDNEREMYFLKWEPKPSPSSTPPKLGAPKEEFENYFKSITLKSLIQKFKSETHHKCSRKGCQYKFVTFDIRELHMQCHTEDGDVDLTNSAASTSSAKRKRFAFKCYQCDHRFDSWKPCLLHYWQAHQTDLGMLRCPLCEKRFGYVVHVFNHLQTHRPKAIREVECRVCQQRFANTAQRSVHEALHRKNGDQATLAVVKQKDVSGEPTESVPQPKSSLPPSPKKSIHPAKPRWNSARRCRICKRMFSNSKILSKHVKTVHFKIKPFICNVCGYKSARKFTLDIHMRQHSGQKPLECQSCSFRTADPSALYYHERRHRDDKSHRCRICGLMTVQPSALKKHIQSYHPQEYERIKCRLCSFASVNVQNLRQHQAEHDAGLIEKNDNAARENSALGKAYPDTMTSTEQTKLKNAPESSLDCFLPLESTDSVVHDTGGITIAASDVPISATHCEDTQFSIDRVIS